MYANFYAHVSTHTHINNNACELTSEATFIIA